MAPVAMPVSSAGPPPPGGDPGERLVGAIAAQIDRFETVLKQHPPPAVLTDAQVDDIGARLARGAVTWIGGMVQAANRRHYALMLAALLAAAIVGGVVTSLAFGLHRWLTPAPPALTCQDDSGGTVCFYWKVPPKPPGKS